MTLPSMLDLLPRSAHPLRFATLPPRLAKLPLHFAEFSRRLAALSLVAVLVASPVALAASDADNDGVSDRTDQCPHSNASAKVDGRGCEFDSDGDGVVDYHDECPDSTTGVAANIRGCAHDSDGDQVVDFRDACSNTNKGVNVDATGCPLGDVLQLPGLKFAQGSSTLNRRARAVLDRAANTLEKYPNLHIEVAGYTDSQGDAGRNRALSQERAEAVRRYLETLGINRSRLSARGYGEENPIASNNSAAGRSINRRVVLKLGDK